MLCNNNTQILANKLINLCFIFSQIKLFKFAFAKIGLILEKLLLIIQLNLWGFFQITFQEYIVCLVSPPELILIVYKMLKHANHV